MSLTILLLIPGLLFLLVVILRVGLPFIKTPGWKRAIENSTYYRHLKKTEKSDRIIEKAVEKYPERPEVYLEYFLNHSDNRNLQHRFEKLLAGWKQTQAPALAFVIGSAYLEDGDLDKAEEYLEKPETREYMNTKRIPLSAQLYYEKGEYQKAESEFYRVLKDEQKGIESPEDLSPEELVLLALITQKQGENWKGIMRMAPKSGIHLSMTWKDYLQTLEEKIKNTVPAETGINGDPSTFNKRRKDFYNERIRIVKDYLSGD